MSLNIRPLSFAMGAAITGIDLAQPLSADAWSAIHRAFLEHLVLVFPGQKITPEQSIAFARHFGALDDHREDPGYTLPGYPEIYMLGNFLRDDGRMSKTKDVGRGWHTDHSYTVRPTKVSMLHCQSVPAVGGTTMFANGYMAYNDLSDTMKALIEDLEGIHDFAWYFTAPSHYPKPPIRSLDRIREKYPAVAHRLVRVHPETGRKALYLSEALISGIVGLSWNESRGLLDSLHRHALRDEYTYRHTYTPGDLLFWDNRCTMHQAPADYVHDANDPRFMHRLTVLGDKSGRFLDESQAEKAAIQ